MDGLKRLPHFDDLSAGDVSELCDALDSDSSGDISAEEFKFYITHGLPASHVEKKELAERRQQTEDYIKWKKYELLKHNDIAISETLGRTLNAYCQNYAAHHMISLILRGLADGLRVQGRLKPASYIYEAVLSMHLSTSFCLSLWKKPQSTVEPVSDKTVSQHASLQAISTAILRSSFFVASTMRASQPEDQHNKHQLIKSNHHSLACSVASPSVFPLSFYLPSCVRSNTRNVTIDDCNSNIDQESEKHPDIYDSLFMAALVHLEQQLCALQIFRDFESKCLSVSIYN